MVLKETAQHYHEPDILQFLRAVDKVVVVGGDGTPDAGSCLISLKPKPLYDVPFGKFAFRPRVRHVGRAQGSCAKAAQLSIGRRIFVAAVNGICFFSMVSLGFDSVVVSALAQVRHGPLSNWGYVWPILKSLACHQAPRITLVVDGSTLISEEQGFLAIIANSKQYALRYEFVPEADSSQAELCVRFIPYRSVLGLLRLALRCSREKSAYISRFPCYRGRQFEINVDKAWG